ncbi:AAA family ATPase [bacterium]|nr:AAA family ATPase [candidate division CSSED10-310 bacterium]
MTFLRAIELKNREQFPLGYPFNLELVKTLVTLSFNSPVTFFVGENASGKSTLLEGMAAATGLPVIGGEPIATDSTMQWTKPFIKHLKLIWSRRTTRGFFMRAEDFFRFARTLSTLVEEIDHDVEDFESRFSGYGLQLAKGSMLGQRRALVDKYGENLHARSHGESFLIVLQERLVPKGLYLLDEPETPLSPQRQLALLAIIKRMVNEEDCQFIISTHSPILMAFPEATIYSFDSYPVRVENYDDLEHVTLTRSFLVNPASFLRHL